MYFNYLYFNYFTTLPVAEMRQCHLNNIHFYYYYYYWTSARS